MSAPAGEHTTRVLASLALGAALLALVLAGVALSRASESEDRMQEISASLRRALEARPRDRAGRPPPALDTEE